MNPPAILLENVHYAWPGQPPLLSLPSLEIRAGERVFLRGPSGSGKSTLLGLVGGVLLPASGSVSVFGERLNTLGPAARDHFRADHLGFIFQWFNLVPYLSVLDNVLLPTLFSQVRKDKAGPDPTAEARRLLAALGLSGTGILERPVTALSIGQQQRVAAARALLGRPSLVIADEPTSALDHDARGAFLELLLREVAAAAATLLFVSHDTALAPLFHRTLSLPDLNHAAPTAAEAAA